MSRSHLKVFGILIATWLFISCHSSPEITAVADVIPPVLLLQSKTDTIILGESWVNPAAIANDNIDQNITSQINIEGSVNTGKPGNYSLIYTISDKAGNESRDTMVVHVRLDPFTVAWYPLDGDPKDYGSNHFDGTVEGKDSLTTDRFGNSRSAYNLDGNTYVNVPYNTAMDFSGAFTVSVWAKSDVPSSYYANTSGIEGFVINMGYGAERDYGIYFSPTMGMTFRYNLTMISEKSVDIQKWHHYAMTFSGDTLKGYIDGHLIGAKPTGVGSIDNNPFRIGCESKQVKRHFKGCVDDLLMVKGAYPESHIKGFTEAGGFELDTAGLNNQDTTHDDTSHIDTTHQDTGAVVKNVKATVTGTSGNLTLKLTWDVVPNAFSYGVYYNTGKSVTKNDYYRVALSNSKTFVGELTEGGEYTFAVTYVVNDKESALSEPITVAFQP